MLDTVGLNVFNPKVPIYMNGIESVIEFEKGKGQVNYTVIPVIQSPIIGMY